MPLPEHPGNEPGWEIKPENVGKRQCIAIIDQGTRRCPKWAMRGLNVCGTHGGLRKATKAAGLARHNEHKAEQRALATLEKRGIRPLEHPIDELERVVAETVNLKDAAAERFATITEWRTTNREGSEQLRAEVSFYAATLKDATKALTDLHKLGLAEKRIALNALQAQRAADAFRTAQHEVLDRIDQGETTDQIRQDLGNIARRHILGST